MVSPVLARLGRPHASGNEQHVEREYAEDHPDEDRHDSLLKGTCLPQAFAVPRSASGMSVSSDR